MLSYLRVQLHKCQLSDCLSISMATGSETDTVLKSRLCSVTEGVGGFCFPLDCFFPTDSFFSTCQLPMSFLKGYLVLNNNCIISIQTPLIHSSLIHPIHYIQFAIEKCVLQQRAELLVPKITSVLKPVCLPMFLYAPTPHQLATAVARNQLLCSILQLNCQCQF